MQKLYCCHTTLTLSLAVWLAGRYPPTTGADLMAQFSLTHHSVNETVGELPANGVAAPFPLPPPAATAAAVAAATLTVAPAAVETPTDAGTTAAAQAATVDEDANYRQGYLQARLAALAGQGNADSGALPAAPSESSGSGANSTAGKHSGPRGKTKIKKVPRTAAVPQVWHKLVCASVGAPVCLRLR